MSDQQTETIDIDGMHCEHCVDIVREALDEVAGVSVEGVDIGSATVAYDPSVAPREAVTEAIEEAGYEIAA